jgi:hypothetical protein
MIFVPIGNINAVLAWVGRDPQRAQQALDAERAGFHRSTLIAKLEAIASRRDTAVATPQTPEQPPQTDNPAAPQTDENTEDPLAGLEAPERPVEVVLYPRAIGTQIGPVHVRDWEVELADDADLRSQFGLSTREADIDAYNLADEQEREEALEADPVEFFQVARAANGVAIMVNGGGFAFTPQLVAALKGEIDKAVAGMAL